MREQWQAAGFVFPADAQPGICLVTGRAGPPVVQPPPEPVKPVPRDEWSLEIRAVAKLAKESDAGVGDTLHRLIQASGAGMAYKALLATLGKTCRCPERRAWLNKRYPYV